MRLILWATLVGISFGQFLPVDPAVEFSPERLATVGTFKTSPPEVFVSGRQIVVGPISEAVAVYVAFQPIPAGTAYQRVSFPFVIDQRLDAFPRTPTQWGSWRGVWPTLRAIVPPTGPAPPLPRPTPSPAPWPMQAIDIPIPPGDFAVQVFTWQGGKGILGELVGIY